MEADKYKDSDYYFISNEQPHPHYWGLLFPKKWFENDYTLTIRQEEYPASSYYDNWLTMVYGDWRKLPPLDQQHPQHVMKIRSLERPGGSANH